MKSGSAIGAALSSLSSDDYVEGVPVMRRTSPVFLFCTAVLMLGCAWFFVSIRRVSLDNREALGKFIGPPLTVLSPWTEGVDQADVQWKDLVRNLPLLGPTLLTVCLVARLIRYTVGGDAAKLSKYLVAYYCVCGLLFVTYLHGAPVLFEIGLVLINFAAIAPLCRFVPFKVFMLVMWTCHVGILFVNDHFKGYRFSLFTEHLRWMDEYLPSGVLRWNVVFNMSTLRMIAFNNDYCEALTLAQEGKSAVHQQARLERHCSSCTDCAALRAGMPHLSTNDPSVLCYKIRTELSRPLSEYNLAAYVAYLFYVPLYVAGPMSSFNAFMSYTHHTSTSMTLRQGVKYAARIAALFSLLTFQLHFNYLNAIREVPTVFDSMSLPVKLGFFLFTLGFLWMKFNFLWKLFRLLAFVDGIEVPEDMNRCFADTVTIQSFWKDWHSSFNLWIVRYMYIPMGGNRNRLLSIFPIFIFIAVWHDIELRLLWWALIMCICFVPEVIVGIVMAKPQMKWLRSKPYYRMLRILGGSCGMFVLIVANLVGYGTGTRNTGKGLAEMFTWDTLKTLVGTMAYLTCGAVVSIRDRDAKEGEKRRLRALYNIKHEVRHDK